MYQEVRALGMCVLLRVPVVAWNRSSSFEMGIGELGLTPVQTLEPSLENAYNCLLKEWRLYQSLEALVHEDTEAKCPWQSAGVRYSASGIPSGWGLPESLMAEAGRHLWRLAAPASHSSTLPRSMSRWLLYSSTDVHCTAYLTGQLVPVLSHPHEKLMSCTGKKLRVASVQHLLTMLSVLLLGCCRRKDAVVLPLCWTTKPFHLQELFHTDSELLELAGRTVGKYSTWVMNFCFMTLV